MHELYKIKMSTNELTVCALFIVIISICSWISIPAAVPFTMQTFAIFLCAGLLGGKLASVTVLCYLIAGAIGLPVFAGFKGGIGALVGPTGGYIAGFYFSVLFLWAVEKLFGDSLKVFAISAIPALLICYALGTLWFVRVYTAASGSISVGGALMMCVVPFIIPDILKIILAVTLSRRLRPFLHTILDQ